ncbi:hypothetical protein PR202_ga24078 [Eleusine coracana subsp. coracana]|uniref:phosphoribosylaminoimidazole carboxylase n=1 Tax=Eleusine coracana subsp. coracana TaxID=191504 RepID=A0AAV5D7K8_ELECO|nr:hypothetical protein PR202_ga24078 [Eleusine coracana subsp. coracana]
MHARLLSAPSSSASAAAAASSSSLPSAGGCPRRASWNPRLASGTTASTQPPLSLRTRAAMQPATPEGEGGPPVHGVSNTVVGVLGGGQLGKMLCQAASQMGIKINILDPLRGLPGELRVQASTLWGASVTVTQSVSSPRVEIEHVDAATLEKLEKQGVDCEPKASTIMTYSALGGFEHGLYVERWTHFVKELSVIVARSRDGSTVCYPVVETIHKDNICHIVKAPAEVSDKIKKLATSVAEKAIKSLEGAGVFAVELFLTEDDEHLRAILGLPLGDPSMKVPAAIMYNILGEDEGEAGFLLAHQVIQRALNIPGASVHWYAKPEIRKQRKMGHITIVGPSKNTVESRLDRLLQRDTQEPNKVSPRVGVIMGSDSDLPTMRDAAIILEHFNIPFEVTIVSAHRTPERMNDYAKSAKDRGVEVIIAGAGGAAHLPGMVASSTCLPVIGVPVSTKISGVDSLLSIVQMPKGIPVAAVAIGNSENAGLLAVRILAIRDSELSDMVIKYQDNLRDIVLEKAKRLEDIGWEEYLK